MTYTWADASSSVKSYANIGLQTGLGVTLDSIGSIPTTWSWDYTRADSDLVADVSYDMWLSTESTCGQAVSCSTYEIMVWLSDRGGCTPAGSYSKTVTIEGTSWKLYTGTVQNWSIFSFVAASEITDFDSDLILFFDYLTEDEGVSSAQFLTGVQSGTEPFTGAATLTTSAYSVSVVQGSSSASASVAVASSSVVDVVSSKASSATQAASSSVKALSSTKAASSSVPVSKSSKSTKAASSTLPVSKSIASTTSSKTSSVAASSASASSASASSCGTAYSQCGGSSFSGATCCVSGYTCTFFNDWYSQCLVPSSTASSSSAQSALVDIVLSAASTVAAASVTSASATTSATSGTNLQTFTGALGGISAPAVTTGGRGYLVSGVSTASFLTLNEALSRSCDIQHNLAANASNAAGSAATYTVGQCDVQDTACKAAI